MFYVTEIYSQSEELGWSTSSDILQVCDSARQPLWLSVSFSTKKTFGDKLILERKHWAGGKDALDPVSECLDPTPSSRSCSSFLLMQTWEAVKTHGILPLPCTWESLALSFSPSQGSMQAFWRWISRWKLKYTCLYNQINNFAKQTLLLWWILVVLTQFLKNLFEHVLLTARDALHFYLIWQCKYGQEYFLLLFLYKEHFSSYYPKCDSVGTCIFTHAHNYTLDITQCSPDKIC